jgi:UDP-glucose 4-epimerase
MSILVTGINGMTGLHTAKILLEKGFAVVGYDNCSKGELAFYPEIEKRITFVWGDITHAGHLLETVEKYKVSDIIHLAALRNEVLYRAIPTELFRVNIDGMVNILELARIGKVGRVVFASSAAVYGKADDPDQTIPEDAPLNPRGIYANSKVMCESLCRAYRNVYDVDTVIIRPSRVYGRIANLDLLEFGNPISTFVSTLMRGEPIEEKSGGDFGGDFTYVPDLAAGCHLALTAADLDHWIFNISSGTFYRLSQVAEVLKALFPRIDIFVGPGIQPYVTQAPMRGALDISRAKKVLSFAPALDLKGSITHFIDNLRRRQTGQEKLKGSQAL